MKQTTENQTLTKMWRDMNERWLLLPSLPDKMAEPLRKLLEEVADAGFAQRVAAKKGERLLGGTSIPRLL
ncbi:hypothetical protein J7E88_31675 [Streptomyces sp. ISL-10]|uniref:hypothetical protein n=1 Tax=Streptomyces sp. ISL-10 TaxID=2819172 RepID=UPI001BE69EED|nr:hypothetical protein [Streptomyces sp. ISL-10]MBT2369708.1 hypothetical protein [Streptomyces sp. ISL-10]